MRANHVKPNKTELMFESWLNDEFPGEWMFVGDGKVIINGKCPDFININGKKHIIEIFGTSWHKGEDPEDRKKVFSPFGYKTLVIWEKDLKNMDLVRCFVEYGFADGFIGK